MNSWRILLVNVTLAHRTGTETALRDLALGLLAAGERPMVYSPLLGDIARELQQAGVAVVDDFDALPDTPDIVHGNHHVETVQALLRFPTARGLFVCHDRTYFASAPPRLARIRRYVAVDHYCLERLVDDYGIPRERTQVIYNTVDTQRFVPRDPLPAAPRRAAVFSHYAGAGTHLEAVRVACARAQLPLDVLGSGSGNSIAQPETLLGQYDLVFAKARCALEAMAVGTAVLLCDAQGVGPMVSTDKLPNLRRWNFGRRVLIEPLTPSTILDRMARYDAADAAAVSGYVRAHAHLAEGVAQYRRLYDDIMAEPPTPPVPQADELAEYLRASATRVHELERELADYRTPYRMEPLADAVGARITLDATPPELPVTREAAFQIAVDVQNDTHHTLASYPPFPVHLVYRWLTVNRENDVETAVVYEGRRHLLRPTLLPGARGRYTLPVVPPPEPGTYRLRITLVQELVMWMDLLPRPAFIDVPIIVE